MAPIDSLSLVLERHLRRIEASLPYLRRHVSEYVQDPTPVHMQQVHGTLQRVELELAGIVKSLR